MVYGLYRALPGDRAFLPPSPARCESIVANLTPASGRQDHTTSPSATSALVRSASCVHRIPPRVRDVREPPLCGTGPYCNSPASTWLSRTISEIQKLTRQMPVSNVGPLMMRGAVHAGLRDLEVGLYGLELHYVDDGRDRHLDNLGPRLALAGLPELGVEAVTADIGRARQHLVDGVDAPAPTVAGSDAGSVEMLGNGLDPHRPRFAIALQGHAEDEAHGLGLEGIYLQNLRSRTAARPLQTMRPASDSDENRTAF